MLTRYVYHIPFIRSMPLESVYIQGEIITQGCECQEWESLGTMSEAAHRVGLLKYKLNPE